MRRALPLAAATAAAAVAFGQLPAAPSNAFVSVDVARVEAAKAAVEKVRTPFALAGAAYGTRVEGGSVPANSDDTAYQRIGCTNLAGDDRANYEADLVIPGLGKAEGVRSRVWTRKANGKVSTYSSHHIARLTIGSSALGSLSITGIRSVVEAFHKNGKFGTNIVESSVARIAFTFAGQTQSFAIPAPGETLTIPGLASISIGKSTRKVSGDGAQILANVLDIRVIPLGTRARVAQTNASIQDGVKQGVFAGYAAGLEGRGLADNLKVGRTPLAVLPCRGTSEEVKEVANVDLGELGEVSGVFAATRANNRTRVARGTVAGQVAEVSLLGGRIEVTGIKGVSTVTRQGRKLTRSSAGSTVLEVNIDGQSFSFPALGKITIPGLVELEDAIEVRTRHGLRVIGLRITLLDGTGAVLDLGVAQVGIRPGMPARG